ncbi:hypothetical protein ACIRUG_34255 (plasmid) [Pseudomonas aeruginosa]|uniref:hypothetical protein n=1 Tax=Pseudomonadaceae TaxID=135621 RepID=UPI0005F11F60|nr:hypothetical protein [Pseudomonas aeruginosa]OWG38607.1 hypothetical protein CAQ69_10730 [Stutzerimonas stutzeri]OZB29641.1 MAG: hypothetical protein B7X51_11335 [Pseudomonas sp. 34-62-33]MBU5707043.1 hypothetical protein [Pseudomonas aeruginosa]MBU5725594.1 hypothetical protein [Pseudomonas aeruginosa]MBU5750021.1 hypothetical protein [Pseudomonas aeruginosa]
MAPYYLYYLSMTPVIVLAQNAESAAAQFGKICGEEFESYDVRELPDYAINATVKNPDGTRSISVGEIIKGCTVEGVIGEFPLDCSAIEISNEFFERGFMLGLNFILMGVPFTQARKISRFLKAGDGFREFKKWLMKYFGIYVSEVKDLKKLHGHAQTLRDMLALQAEKNTALNAAVEKVNKAFEEREAALRGIITE